MTVPFSRLIFVRTGSRNSKRASPPLSHIPTVV